MLVNTMCVTAFLSAYYMTREKSSEIMRSFVKTFLLPLKQAAACLSTRACQHGDVVATRVRVMARQTKITIETESVLVLRGRSSVRAWCPQCASEGEMIPIEGVGVISNLSPVEVEAWLESESIHRSQTADGGLVICLNSLLKRIQKTKTA